MKRMLKEIPLARSLYQSYYERRFSGECFGCFRGVFETFEQAIQSAPKSKNIGYNEPEVAERYKKTFKITIQSYDYPILFWLKELIPENGKNFDFGGNVGIHFYSYEKYISYPPNLKWIVCELPEIVESGKKLAEREKRTELVFTSSFELASETDIFIASGSIQYVKFIAADLSRLAKKPKYLLINRLPLYEGKQFVTLQNGGEVFYPQYVFNKKEFISSIQAVGYEIVDIWEDRFDSCIIPSYPEKSVPFYHGIYFKLES